MLAHNVSGIRLQPQQVLCHGIAHRDETVAPFQEVFRERSVEETLLVRNHIVQNTDYLAVFSGMSCHETERRREIGHPVPHDEDIRPPFPDFLCRAYPGKRIGRIKYCSAFHRRRFIIRRDILSLARKQEVRVLPGEIERLDDISFAQFGV